MWPFRYPYTNFHELNLDWIIETCRQAINLASSKDKPDSAVFVDVTDYGAIGDGRTDCTPAINQAITVALAGGKILYFPAGNYAVLSGINFGGVTLKSREANVGALFNSYVTIDSSGRHITIGADENLIDNRSVVEYCNALFNSPIGEVSILATAHTKALDGRAGFPVASMGFAVADDAANNSAVVGGYFESGKKANSSSTIEGVEIDLSSNVEGSRVTPYAKPSTSSNAVIGLVLSNGVEHKGAAGADAKKASCAILIHSNPETFNKGIVFGQGSTPEAISLPEGCAIAFYKTDGSYAALINGAADGEVHQVATPDGVKPLFQTNQYGIVLYRGDVYVDQSKGGLQSQIDAIKTHLGI